jgi:hypothetical protein
MKDGYQPKPYPTFKEIEEKIKLQQEFDERERLIRDAMEKSMPGAGPALVCLTIERA